MVGTVWLLYNNMRVCVTSIVMNWGEEKKKNSVIFDELF